MGGRNVKDKYEYGLEPCVRARPYQPVQGWRWNEENILTVLLEAQGPICYHCRAAFFMARYQDEMVAVGWVDSVRSRCRSRSTLSFYVANPRGDIKISDSN